VNKKHFMSIFILAIMVLSVFGIAVSHLVSTGGSSQSVKFRGQKFQQYQGGWITYLDDVQILIPTQPDLLQYQQVPDITFANLNSGGKVYFTSNPGNQLPQNALFSIQSNIFPYIRNVVVACIEDSEVCANIPLATCSDASPTSIVIQAEISSTPITTFQNNCLLIQGPSHSITQQVDALVLQLHGIK
jgi:hypothetical protein